jgi:hypothetical protein
MPTETYRVESEHPIESPLFQVSGATEILLRNADLAVVMAAKSRTVPVGREIRVVHVPTGEVVFRKSAAGQAGTDDGAARP